MAFDHETAKDDETLDGERGITSIAESTGVSKKNAELGKNILFAAGVVFLAFLTYLQWPSDTEEPVEVVEESTRHIRSNNQFQPADIADPAPKPAATEAPVVLAAAKPMGPIEQMRKEEAFKPAEPTEAEMLFESSKRAPLMAFEGSSTNQAQKGTADSTGGGLFGSSNGGQNQERTGFASQLEATQTDASFATVLKNPHLTITQGTIIPCSLDTAMDSTQPGMVRCTVNDDIYSTTGTVVLLEKGTRLIGQYRGGLRRGTKRLFVIWTRAETPHSVVVTLDSGGTDALGRSGFDGDIDTQFWTRFGGTIMLSIIDDALAAAVARHSNAENYENTTDGVSSLAQTELQNSINVPIILTKNQGEQVAVMVARDLDFSNVYRLETR